MILLKFCHSRTYWIASMSWTADGLFLACMTKRGCLVIFPRLGQPLKLITHGCSLDMGPNTFLSLHPLITITRYIIILYGKTYLLDLLRGKEESPSPSSPITIIMVLRRIEGKFPTFPSYLSIKRIYGERISKAFSLKSSLYYSGASPYMNFSYLAALIINENIHCQFAIEWNIMVFSLYMYRLVLDS